jgi:DNA-binding GntR family transcriptional regulator
MEMKDVAVEDQDSQNVASVHEALREAIITCQLPPGTVSSQVALARQLGAGRTPLREALRLLQSEGLVAGEPHRRVRIAEISAQDLEDLSLIRLLVEGAAVRQTVPTLDSSDVAEMRGLMAQMDHYRSDGDWAGLRRPHKAFHMKFVGHAGARVVKMVDVLFDHSDRYRQAIVAATAEQWAERQTEHQLLVDAAAERDGDLVAERLVEHYLKSATLVMATLDPDRKLTGIERSLGSLPSNA